MNRRIMVVGTSGSGKSYLAQKLAHALDVPYICNDAIIWQANWTPTPRRQRFAEFDRATSQPGWTYDGNVGSLRDREDAMILERAQMIVWLDLPKLEVMRQLLIRTIRRSWNREELWHGNTESWGQSFASKDSILWWSWTSHARHKKQYRAIFDDPRWGHLTKVRLRSRAAAERWFKMIARNAVPARKLDRG